MQRQLPCTIFLFAFAATSGLAQQPSLQPPNIIHFIVDDVGYDDIACFGASTIKTPNLDALAARGIRFTNYYSPAPLCSASRAAILTGCYAERVGIPGALMPHSKIGLSQKEITIALIAGAAIPTDRVIDGKDIRPLLFGELDAKSPHEHFYYYHSFRLGAVRQGPWKLMIEPTGKGFDVPNIPTGKPSKPQLFNLDRDLGETTDLADEQPEIVKRLMDLAEHAREDLGDSSQGRIGKGMHER